MLQQIDNRLLLADFFARDRALHLYEIGDLDPFFWPHTRWYCLGSPADARALALLYTGSDQPTVLLFERREPEAAVELFRSLRSVLPPRFYAHLSPGLADELDASALLSREPHIKMVLADRTALEGIDAAEVCSLAPADEAELLAFYRQCYPGNWFVPRMLKTGQYAALRQGSALTAVAGVHVYSSAYRVAALGNIATRPEWRGRGLARRVTAELCRRLLTNVDTIGLNVHRENRAAIRCYQRLGFERVADYEECAVAL